MIKITYQPGEIEHSGDVAREVAEVEKFGGRLVKEETLQDGPYDFYCELTVEFPGEAMANKWHREAIGGDYRRGGPIE